jgi:hypothetical protein
MKANLGRGEQINRPDMVFHSVALPSLTLRKVTSAVVAIQAAAGLTFVGTLLLTETALPNSRAGAVERRLGVPSAQRGVSR